MSSPTRVHISFDKIPKKPVFALKVISNKMSLFPFLDFQTNKVIATVGLLKSISRLLTSRNEIVPILIALHNSSTIA